MNTHQIAAEAWNKIRNEVVICSCNPTQYQQATAIIEAAIEKAIAASYGIVPSTVQPPTGSVLATESRAAHASEPPFPIDAHIKAQDLGDEQESGLPSECHGRISLRAARANDEAHPQIAEEAARQIRGRIVDLTGVSLDYRDDWLERIIEKTMKPAEKLCQIYFEIAAAAIGEDAVRIKRDAMIESRAAHASGYKGEWKFGEEPKLVPEQ